MNKKQSCQSCMMPFSQDPGKREDDRYCSYCYKDGDFTYKGDLKGFKKICYEGMRNHRTNFVTAWVLSRMVGFAPRWKK